MKFVAALCAVAALLGGCAQLRDIVLPAPEAPREASRDAPREASREAAQTEPERMLGYFARLRRMPANELARERENARRAMVGEGSDEQRMRYAIALAVTVDGSVDAARAMELVDPVARRRDSPHQGLAIALRSLLADLHAAQSERAELQRKLDSLKALEKSLSGREGAGR